MENKYKNLNYDLDKVVKDLFNCPDLADLTNQFLPYLVKLKTTLVYLENKEIENKNSNNEFDLMYYELNEFINNQISNTFISYMKLPIEYRNTKIVKNNKNAHEILIDNTNIIINNINLIEERLNKDVEKNFLIQTEILNTKNIDQIGSRRVINKHFDYQQFKLNHAQELKDYKFSQAYQFSKTPGEVFNEKKAHELAVIEQRIQKRKEKIDNFFKYLNKANQYLINSSKATKRKIKNGLPTTDQVFASIGVSLLIGLFGGPLFMMGRGMLYDTNEWDLVKGLKTSQTMLAKNSSAEGLEEAKKQLEELIKDEVSTIDIKHINADQSGLNLAIKVDSSDCKSIVYKLNHVIDTNKAHLKINKAPIDKIPVDKDKADKGNKFDESELRNICSTSNLLEIGLPIEKPENKIKPK